MIDWFGTFRPAVLCLINGNCDPYSTIYNVPWSLFPLIPFALLPIDVGAVLLGLTALASFVLVGLRLSKHRLGVVAFVLNPFTYNALMFGNVEWLTLLGLVAHPAVGLFLLAIKPQMTAGVIAFILLEQVWKKNYRRCFIWLGWLGCATILSCMVTPLISRLFTYTAFHDTVMNTSVGWIGIPIGASLLIWSILNKQRAWAIAASPFLFAVVTPQSWLVVPLAMTALPTVAVAAAISLWTYVGWVRT
jgi:hypothetical protein